MCVGWIVSEYVWERECACVLYLYGIVFSAESFVRVLFDNLQGKYLREEVVEIRMAVKSSTCSCFFRDCEYIVKKKQIMVMHGIQVNSLPLVNNHIV